MPTILFLHGLISFYSKYIDWKDSKIICSLFNSSVGWIKSGSQQTKNKGIGGRHFLSTLLQWVLFSPWSLLFESSPCGTLRFPAQSRIFLVLTHQRSMWQQWSVHTLQSTLPVSRVLHLVPLNIRTILLPLWYDVTYSYSLGFRKLTSLGSCYHPYPTTHILIIKLCITWEKSEWVISKPQSDIDYLLIIE